MTNFNHDPRVRDLEPNTTALGPNFPSSLGDLQRMSYRPSEELMRYVKLAVSNDDGSGVAARTNELLAELLVETRVVSELLRALLEDVQTAAEPEVVN